MNENADENAIDVIIDGKKLTAQEAKKIQAEQYKNDTIDNIWFSINNKEITDKNGNSYIEGTYNNNNITINGQEYHLRHNANQIIEEVNDSEYKIFQTYVLPKENYQKSENIILKLSNLEILANKTQLGDTQKRIYILDNYEIKLQQNDSIKTLSNLSTANSINNNVKISQKIDYVSISPIQTTMKISTQLDNVNYEDLVNSNSENYIGQIDYEIYDENNNTVSSYKVETKRKITYSDGSTEEWETDSVTPSKYFKNAKLELTQFLICEKSSNNLTIKTVNENKNVVNELKINLAE